MRRVSAFLVCSLAWSIVGAARPATAGAAEGATREVELRLVDNAQPGVTNGYAQIRLDAKGEGSTPFANAAGKLLVKFADGKVFCDANGDGAIDAADGEGIDSPRPGRPAGAPPVLRPTVRIAGRDEEYPLTVLYAQQGIVVLGSAAHLEGKLGDSTVELHDANVNGSFTDVGKDVIRVRDAGASVTPSPFGPQGAQLGRVVEIGGELYDIKLMRGGASLRLSPYTGEKATLSVKTGELIGSVTLTLAHKDGLFTCSATSKEATTLPTGEYRITQSRLELALPRKATRAPSAVELLLGGARTSPPTAMLLAYGDARTPLLTMRAGENELSPGRPFVLAFAAHATGEGGKLEVTDVCLVGALGERYRAQIYGAGFTSKLTVNLCAGGKEKELSKLEYG